MKSISYVDSFTGFCFRLYHTSSVQFILENRQFVTLSLRMWKHMKLEWSCSLLSNPNLKWEDELYKPFCRMSICPYSQWKCSVTHFLVTHVHGRSRFWYVHNHHQYTLLSDSCHLWKLPQSCVPLTKEKTFWSRKETWSQQFHFLTPAGSFEALATWSGCFLVLRTASFTYPLLFTATPEQNLEPAHKTKKHQCIYTSYYGKINTMTIKPLNKPPNHFSKHPKPLNSR